MFPSLMPTRGPMAPIDEQSVFKVCVNPGGLVMATTAVGNIELVPYICYKATFQGPLKGTQVEIAHSVRRPRLQLTWKLRHPWASTSLDGMYCVTFRHVHRHTPPVSNTSSLCRTAAGNTFNLKSEHITFCCFNPRIQAFSLAGGISRNGLKHLNLCN